MQFWDNDKIILFFSLLRSRYSNLHRLIGLESKTNKIPTERPQTNSIIMLQCSSHILSPCHTMKAHPWNKKQDIASKVLTVKTPKTKVKHKFFALCSNHSPCRLLVPHRPCYPPSAGATSSSTPSSKHWPAACWSVERLVLLSVGWEGMRWHVDMSYRAEVTTKPYTTIVPLGIGFGFRLWYPLCADLATDRPVHSFLNWIDKTTS